MKKKTVLKIIRTLKITALIIAKNSGAEDLFIVEKILHIYLEIGCDAVLKDFVKIAEKSNNPTKVGRTVLLGCCQCTFFVNYSRSYYRNS